MSYTHTHAQFRTAPGKKQVLYVLAIITYSRSSPAYRYAGLAVVPDAPYVLLLYDQPGLQRQQYYRSLLSKPSAWKTYPLELHKIILNFIAVFQSLRTPINIKIPTSSIPLLNGQCGISVVTPGRDICLCYWNLILFFVSHMCVSLVSTARL